MFDGRVENPPDSVKSLSTLNAPLGSNSVQFTFASTDASGSWRIDDVYVDPWVDRG